MRLIDAEVLLVDKVSNAYISRFEIELAPTVHAAQVVHGEWIKLDGDYEGSTFARCSACNGGNFHAPTDYCPRCGAKMVWTKGENT